MTAQRTRIIAAFLPLFARRMAGDDTVPFCYLPAYAFGTVPAWPCVSVALLPLRLLRLDGLTYDAGGLLPQHAALRTFVTDHSIGRFVRPFAGCRRWFFVSPFVGTVLVFVYDVDIAAFYCARSDLHAANITACCLAWWTYLTRCTVLPAVPAYALRYTAPLLCGEPSTGYYSLCVVVPAFVWLVCSAGFQPFPYVDYRDSGLVLPARSVLPLHFFRCAFAVLPGGSLPPRRSAFACNTLRATLTAHTLPCAAPRHARHHACQLVTCLHCLPLRCLYDSSIPLLRIRRY
jgi:hypothetical protein